jgi:hypothetical protein
MQNSNKKLILGLGNGIGVNDNWGWIFEIVIFSFFIAPIIVLTLIYLLMPIIMFAPLCWVRGGLS